MAIRGGEPGLPHCVYFVTFIRHTPEGTGNVEIYPASLSRSDTNVIYSNYDFFFMTVSRTGKSIYR